MSARTDTVVGSSLTASRCARAQSELIRHDERSRAMTRTFALSRQRRRRTNQHKPMMPMQDGSRYGAPLDEGPLGDELERAPGTRRTHNGYPADTATQGAGARPSAPRLPHEHDEHSDTPQPPRDPIIQAEQDLAEGQQDTDCRSEAGRVFEGQRRRRNCG
jgi:hypothetical protein